MKTPQSFPDRPGDASAPLTLPSALERTSRVPLSIEQAMAQAQQSGEFNLPHQAMEIFNQADLLLTECGMVAHFASDALAKQRYAESRANAWAKRKDFLERIDTGDFPDWDEINATFNSGITKLLDDAKKKIKALLLS